MKGIMFNNKTGLHNAVLNKIKTRTWRADKNPRYKIGEIIAIKESYESIFNSNKEHSKKIYIYDENDGFILSRKQSPGWTNKMFVKNDLMPHHIKITGIKPCKLQELSNSEALNEGIIKISDCEYKVYGLKTIQDSPLNAFKYLINLLNGINYWNSNPDGYAYEFELID